MELQEKIQGGRSCGFYKLEASQPVQFRVSAIGSGFQPNHEASFSRNIHGFQDEYLKFPESLNSEKLVKGKPRCNQFPKTGQTDVNLRYKENTIYIHLAKILIIKPPTASFHGAINSFA